MPNAPDAVKDIIAAINALNSDIVAAVGGIALPDATETVKGIAEIATQAETDAGADDTRIVTPKKLAAYSGLGGADSLLFCQGLGAAISPIDNDNLYLATVPADVGSASTHNRWYVPAACHVKRVVVSWYATGVAGTSEQIQCDVITTGGGTVNVLNIANGNANKLFYNNALNVACSALGSIYLKLTCPTWATNPTNVWLNWQIYIQFD